MRDRSELKRMMVSPLGYTGADAEHRLASGSHRSLAGSFWLRPLAAYRRLRQPQGVLNMSPELEPQPDRLTRIAFYGSLAIAAVMMVGLLYFLTR